MAKPEGDIEAGRAPPSIPHWKLILDQSLVTDEVLSWQYDGLGSEEDPYVVAWIDNDPRNPLLFRKWRKWLFALTMAVATLSVSFSSSGFAGGAEELMHEFNASQEVVTLGLSLFVLGFAVGPLAWAPMSELYGRQILYFSTFGAFVAFNLGVTLSKNIWSILILRFLAGSCGASPLTNGGGVVADLFPAKERGLAMTIFSSAPFMGPVIGPIVGSFIGETIGWRWINGVITMFTGVVWILGSIIVPETYPPVLLRKRADKLSKITGRCYRSRADIDQGKVSTTEALKTALSRPWILLVHEPIVVLLSIYMAIVYGTLYLLFSAIPFVFVETRGWSAGAGGLAFVGVAIGQVLAIIYSLTFDNKQYQIQAKKHSGFAPPEARLAGSMIGGIALPIGLFWFAWTNGPTIPWQASVAATIPFGFGMVLVFMSIMNYLIDSYTIFAASVLAANSVLRSVFGAIFPLFTRQMYDSLGIHWASAIPAFLALACVPFPFIFYKYGGPIRHRCKFAAEADAFMKKIRGQAEEETMEDDVSALSDDADSNKEKSFANTDSGQLEEMVEEAFETHLRPRQSFMRFSFEDDDPRIEDIRAAGGQYEASPYDIDRLNTRESFRRPRSRASSRSRRRSRSRGSSRPRTADEDDEETLQLKLQAIEARLKLHRLRRAKAKKQSLATSETSQGPEE